MGGALATGGVPSMTQLLDACSEQLILWIAVVAMLLAVGIYLAGKIRAKPVQKEPVAGELLTKFREMHSRGVLSDAEFRTIKTTLATQMQQELKDNGRTG